MRRTVLLVLLTAAMFAVWLAGGGWAQGTEVLVVPASSVAAPGETFIVEIQVRNVVNLYGVDIGLTFDATKLEVQDADGNSANGVQIAPGSFLNPGQGFLAQNTVENSTGQVRYVFALMAPAPGVSGSGVLASLTLRARTPGSSVLGLSALLVNEAAQPIAAVVSGGAVIISGATATPSVTSTRMPTAVPSSTPTPTVSRTPTGQVAGRHVFLPLVWRDYPPPTATPSPTAAGGITPSPTPSLTGTVVVTPSATPHYRQLVVNPSFETDEAWTLLGGYLPGYSVSRAHTGLRSMRLGIIAPYPRLVYSSVQQTVDIPSGVTEAQLSFYYFPVSSGADGDFLYFVLLRASDKEELRRETWMDHRQSWNLHTIELREYAGQGVTLQLGLYNDGQGVSAVYLDDVELWVVTSE